MLPEKDPYQQLDYNSLHRNYNLTYIIFESFKSYSKQYARFELKFKQRCESFLKAWTYAPFSNRVVGRWQGELS